MAQYSRIVAKGVAVSAGLSDEYVESILRFSPLHDIGKIAVPDHILLKQSALSPAEFAVNSDRRVTGKGFDECVVNESIRSFHRSPRGIERADIAIWQ